MGGSRRGSRAGSPAVRQGAPAPARAVALLAVLAPGHPAGHTPGTAPWPQTSCQLAKNNSPVTPGGGARCQAAPCQHPALGTGARRVQPAVSPTLLCPLVSPGCSQCWSGLKAAGGLPKKPGTVPAPLRARSPLAIPACWHGHRLHLPGASLPAQPLAALRPPRRLLQHPWVPLGWHCQLVCALMPPFALSLLPAGAPRAPPPSSKPARPRRAPLACPFSCSAFPRPLSPVSLPPSRCPGASSRGGFRPAPLLPLPGRLSRLSLPPAHRASDTVGILFSFFPLVL